VRRRVSGVLCVLLVGSLAGCVELAGAAIDAGIRSATDHGKHPLYEHKSYGEHFVDSLLEEDRPTREVDVVIYEKRHHR
jgi:hypothetical protein